MIDRSTPCMKLDWITRSIVLASRLCLMLGAMLPLICGCQSAGTATQGTAGLELQNEDYREARSRFQTHLVRQQPAPQQGEALTAPAGAQQVVYSRTFSLKAWISSAPSGSAKRPAVLFLHGGF